MPVARSDSRKALLIGIAAVVAAAAIGFLLFTLSGEPDKVTIGPSGAAFVVGDARSLAAAVERDRTPLLFQDPASFERPIWVQHTRDDPERGWLAFDAQVGGCALRWELDDQRFVGCDGAHYPADGEGLTQYEATVRDGDVVVDLDPNDGPATSASTTTILQTGDG